MVNLNFVAPQQSPLTGGISTSTTQSTTDDIKTNNEHLPNIVDALSSVQRQHLFKSPLQLMLCDRWK